MSDSKSRKNPLYVGKSGKGVFDSEAPNSSIPAHLLEPNWLEYEYDTAMGVVDSIQACIKPFRRKTGNKSIHNLRVALRRWFSIWEVLVEDGWQSGSYQDKLGRRLKRFYKLLGRIRDQDVNCKLAEKEKLEILRQLTAAEGIERYLHTKYVGQKRFSLEGADSMIPALDEVVRSAARSHVDEIVTSRVTPEDDKGGK